MLRAWHGMILLSFPQTPVLAGGLEPGPTRALADVSSMAQSAQASLIECLVRLCNYINLQCASVTPRTTYFTYFGLYFYSSWCLPTFTLDQYLKLDIT